MPEQHDPTYAAAMAAKSQLRLARLTDGGAPPVLLAREEELLATWQAHLKRAVVVSPSKVPERAALLGAVLRGIETGESESVMSAALLLEAAYPDEEAT